MDRSRIWIRRGALPDSKVGNIIENSILPYFKEDNYSEGILSGFNEIINEIEEEYNMDLEREKKSMKIYMVLVSHIVARIFLIPPGKFSY